MKVKLELVRIKFNIALLPRGRVGFNHDHLGYDKYGIRVISR